MERRFFRSTSVEHLAAELHRHELLREARMSADARRAIPAEPPLRHRGISRGIRVLVRRLAG